MQTVIVTGNQMDGLNVLGPFDNPENAIEYGNKNIDDDTWWTSPLIDPSVSYNFDITF
jgi:hypothetical protein